MQTLIEVLFNYAQENQVSDYLQTAEYRQAISGIEDSWDGFRSTLTEEQGERLDALLLRETAISCLEEEAAFCSALSIGLSLGRL